MTDEKKYLIDIYLKETTIDRFVQGYVDLYFKSIKNQDDSNIEKIKNQYNYQNYIKMIYPIIDDILSLSDLKEIIKMLRSDTGKMMKEKGEIIGINISMMLKDMLEK